jgi:hypothetical protein
MVHSFHIDLISRALRVAASPVGHSISAVLRKSQGLEKSCRYACENISLFLGLFGPFQAGKKPTVHGLATEEALGSGLGPERA